MSLMKIIVVSLLCFIALSTCEHFILGNVNNNRNLIYHSNPQYNAIPFIKRTKSVFFSSPDQTAINSIMVYDNLHTKASATVTAGGVGYTYVNIRLKSERGKGLDYDVGIYS